MPVLKKKKPEYMNDIMDDIFHAEEPICQIIPTNPQTKVNCFASFRPKPGTCLEYHISQTDTRMDAGQTKIHVQETRAEYVPNPEKPPKKAFKANKYFSGTEPPISEYLENIWRKQQDEKQKQFHVEFKIRVARRKKEELGAWLQVHKKLLNMAGPAWFQELSPNQIKTINNLKNCILKDLDEGTIINTQENIAKLGLVLRPNRKHIATALKTCCKCPVEFLLVLYQLINPKRNNYSINDRLLLSAMTHLSMMNTLKELHIRIPSPPPEPKKKLKETRKQKRKKYDSPYLEPYTFKRTKARFTGIYGNKHVQHPQSPYFCYLSELRRKQEYCIEVKKEKFDDAIEEEIQQELEYAQRIYESLVNFRPVPTLLKPSVYIQCKNFQTKLSEDVATEVKKPENIIQNEEKDIQTVTETCHAGTEIQAAETGIQGVETEDKNEDGIQGAETEDKNEDGIQDVETEDKNEDEELECGEAECCALEKEESEDKVAANDEKTNVIVKNDRSECYIVPEKKTCKHVKDIAVYTKMYPLIRPKTEVPPCKCKAKHRKFIDQEPCNCERCQEDRRLKNINYVIAGMKDDSDQATTIIDRVVESKKCDCLKRYEERVESFERERHEAEKITCDCRAFVKSQIDKSPCKCELCVESRRAKASKYIIAGKKEEELVIDGISTGRPCPCAEKYEKKTNKYEAFEKRKEMIVNLKEQDKKFVIGGVCNTAKGPAFVISGLRPAIDCMCAKKAREEAAIKHMQEIMPHVPPGRIQFGIVGVKETDKGNVFILNNAIPREDCECMGLYKTFKNQHDNCLQMYDDFLKKVQEEYNEFMNDMLPPSSSRKSSVFSAKAEEEPEKIPSQQSVDNEDQTVEKGKVCSLEEEKQEDKCYVEEKTCCCVSKKEEKIECVDCTCGPIEEIIEEEEVIEEEEEPVLKRFFIFKKILCNPRWQRAVIRKALQSMADDGYPLAKLPQAYKLPHFKLWMEMRCGKFWTLEDRYKCLRTSRDLWNHTDRCKEFAKIILPKLPLSREEAKTVKWSQAGYCRKMVRDSLEAFARRGKQNRIHFGREFFSTTYTYEFPFKTWRDCYFAYTGTKEEEVLAERVWQVYDCRNVADMKRGCR